jgi:hypothetical protein
MSGGAMKNSLTASLVVFAAGCQAVVTPGLPPSHHAVDGGTARADLGRPAMPDLLAGALPDLAPVATPDLLVAPSPDLAPAASPDLAPPPTMLDLHQATIYNNPVGLADWPVTTLITDVEFQLQGDGVHVEFSKRDDGTWPDVTPPGWTGSLEYTLGMVENINGQWYASAAIQFWRGLPASGGNVALDNQVAKNWYYDGRWGALAGYQPKTGELIGLFVVAGNARGVTDDGSQSPVRERSNVVLVPMPDVNGAKYTF